MFWELTKTGSSTEFSKTSFEEVDSVVACLGYTFVDGHKVAKLPPLPAGTSTDLLPRRMCLSACH